MASSPRISAPTCVPVEGDSVESGLLQEAPSTSGHSVSRRARLGAIAVGLGLCCALLSERGFVGARFTSTRHGTISFQDAQVPAQAAAGGDGGCLCLFDVDRTLTVKQGMAAQCPGSQEHQGVHDTAYQGGDLVLSVVGANLAQTGCGQCHRGIISMGPVSGPDEKAVIQQGDNFPDAVGLEWSTIGQYVSPLVKGCPDAEKANCAKGIVDWFAAAKQLQFAPQNVYFFDDHTGNTQGFDAYGFNAREISCASRDESMASQWGVCGAQMDEVQLQPGIINC